MNSTDILDIAISDMVDWSLKVENSVRKIYESVESIPTENDKRIKLVMDKLLSGKDSLGDKIPAIPRPGKNPNVGIRHRNRGDEIYRSNDKRMAMIHYTQAIAYAVENTTLLALSLNNRSKCLYELGMFHSCIQDIQLIPLPNLSKDLKGDLFYRRAMCHRAIACKLLIPVLKNPQNISEVELKKYHQNIEDYNKLNIVPYNKPNEVNYKLPEPPLLAKKHSLIPGLSNALELNYTEKDGRYITASRNILPGELVGVCKPYVSVVNFRDRFNFCWHCTKQVWNGISCEWCTCTIYCSDNCREAAFKTTHDIECHVLPRLCAYGVDQDILMTLRVTIQAYKQCESNIYKLMDNYHINDKTPTKDEMCKKKYEPEKYSSFHNLWSDFKTNSHGVNSKIFVKSLAIAYHLGISIGLIREGASLNYLKNYDEFVYLFGFIERAMRIVKFNQFHHEMNTQTKGLKENIITSSTINPSLSLFNHHCLNNVIRIRKGDYEFVYAISPIEKGAQVYSNYYKNDYSKATEKERKDYLLSNFGIDCNCMACTDDWVLKDDIITEDNSKYLTEIKQNLEKVGKQITVLRKIASRFFCQNNKLNDVSKYIEAIVEVVNSCYEHLDLNSSDLVNSRLYLSQILQLSQVPLVYPE
ncbi:SET and MYND domain-containing protein DDB_G0273591-like [Aphidius gifuensis]|uniref:SET and MYND domain-containing protein DDB_G0273591-like n=1 Tax=Aphidius gifuensis TaxID=684658 RepID=UPI001CDC52DD|nr:SET and MYND domain-containing protein DDB_G0273591-like [Aphidius gifuensis]